MAAAAALQGSPSASSSERIGRNDPAPQRALGLLVPAWSSSQSSPPTMLQEWAPKNPFPEAPPTPRCQPLRPPWGATTKLPTLVSAQRRARDKSRESKGVCPKAPSTPRGRYPHKEPSPKAKPAPRITRPGNQPPRHPGGRERNCETPPPAPCVPSTARRVNQCCPTE